MYSSDVFTGSTTLRSNFTWTRSPPSTTLGIKTIDTGLPDGEDRIPLRSVIDTILECDGQTDGYAAAYTALAKLALRRAVKMCQLAI